MIEDKTIRPKSAILLPTLGCNLRCKMCFHWQNKEEGVKRLDINEWKGFIDSFQEVVNGGAGDDAFSIVFGGGEPLMFAEEVINMVAFCTNKGYRTSLATNGYILNEPLIRRFIDAGLNNIGLSLDSLDEAIHDNLRGVRGGYAKVMEATESFKRFNNSIRIAINTIIMAPNLGEIIRLVEYVKKESHISSILFQAIVQPFHSQPEEDWQRYSTYSFLWPNDIKTVYQVIDKLIELKETNDRSGKIDNRVSQLKAFKAYFENPQRFIKTLKCNAVDTGFFTIGPDGTINLCPYMESVGNAREGTLKDIWYSEKAVKVREKMLNCKRNCHHLVNCWFEEEPHAQEKDRCYSGSN